jgi:hypothetical protein
VSLQPNQTSSSLRRNAAAARREAKLEKNDYQRLNENLLRIALKRHTSTNSLTDQDPLKVAMEKKLAWEDEMGRKLNQT